MSIQKYSNADIHMHTNLGDGMASPQQVVDRARKLGLRVIAVTDHDQVEGAYRVQELAAKGGPPLDVIIGCEVTTRNGHFLALFVHKPLKMLRPVEETIEEIKTQGGLCIVPHPFARLVPSLSRAKLESLLERGVPLDGIEIYNPTPAGAPAATLRACNQRYKLAETGGSDAHFLQSIGSAYTRFSGSTAEDFRQSLLTHTTTPGGEELPPVHIPIPAMVVQCARAWFVDPPRKMARRWKAGT